MTDVFAGLQRGHYGAVLADPPWHFEAWASPPSVRGRAAESHYETLSETELSALPVAELAAPNCVLFMWACWPTVQQAFRIIEAWGFTYKTCGFLWAKARANQLEMFQDHIEGWMGLGYWTRSNSELCLLATRGQPKRQAADVKQVIIEPAREHSRKPDCVHERIERLVAGPYLEIFARQRRPGWDCWGNEVDRFAPQHAPEPAQESWADMWAKPFDFSQEPQP